MAKKRKEPTEEEELDFKFPKFDEEKFMQRERRNIKTMFLSFLFGTLIAVISFGFWAVLRGSPFRWELVLLIGVFNASWLKYLFLRLNIDLTDFGRKGWFGTFAVYFITWLVLVIVLVNPPFYDDEIPQVSAVALPGVQEPGGSVLIAALITDNVGVKVQGVNFTMTDPNGIVSYPDFTFEKNILRYRYENTENATGVYHFSIIATDVNGLVNTAYENMTFEYSNNTLEITSSIPSPIKSGDSIVISANEKISPENFRVYYRVDNGSEINVDRKDPNSNDKYETSTEYQGWKANANVTMTVYAEARHYFVNVPERFNNTVHHRTTYQFTTGIDPKIGTATPLVEYNYTLAALRKGQLPNTLNYPLAYPVGVGGVPGFETLLFILALVVVVFIVKKKKNQRRS